MELNQAAQTLEKIKTRYSAHLEQLPCLSLEAVEVEMDIAQVTTAINNLDATIESLRPQEPVYTGGE